MRRAMSGAKALMSLDTCCCLTSHPSALCSRLGLATPASAQGWPRCCRDHMPAAWTSPRYGPCRGSHHDAFTCNLMCDRTSSPSFWHIGMRKACKQNFAAGWTGICAPPPVAVEMAASCRHGSICSCTCSCVRHALKMCIVLTHKPQADSTGNYAGHMLRLSGPAFCMYPVMIIVATQAYIAFQSQMHL